MNQDTKKRAAAPRSREKKPQGKGRTASSFPIVAIGASAGGLEAIEQFLTSLPNSPAMAFVVVQHLEPSHASRAAEIFARKTAMPVIEARDGMRIEINHVYVMSANTSLQVERGALKVTSRSDSPGQHLPVNVFFQSLAKDRKKDAVGIVLSGTASDGTLGLAAIKKNGGITIAQDPKSAKYDGMPRSAISAGVADFVLNPESMGRELARILKAPARSRADLSRQGSVVNTIGDTGLQGVLEVLQQNCHLDFSHYKPTTLKRRIARRMVMRRMDDLESYLKFLRGNDEEAKLLFSDLLINVTEFFRDPDSYEKLCKTILPGIVKSKDADSPIRVWVVGCATGEEAYSIAICLLEVLGSKVRSMPNIQIFATDVAEAAVSKARHGVFPESIKSNVSVERLRRFFTKTETGYRVNQSVRDLCLFSRHDVTKDPPFAKMDLISCRNVLIYFDLDLQRHVLPLFHYALNPRGVLWVGRSESVAGLSALFVEKARAGHFYSRSLRSTPVSFKFPRNKYLAEKVGYDHGQSRRPSTANVQDEVTRRLLAKYAPPGLVVNSEMEIVLSNGDTSPYVQLSSGQASLNLFKMVRSEINADLRMALRDAKKRSVSTGKSGIKLRDGARTITFNLSVVPLKVPNEGLEPYFLILFEPVPRPESSIRAAKGNAKNRDGRALERQLAETKAYQLAIVEDFEAAQEQLAAANEELQSANEEMQSTNEELETAKEELQSTNEELTTVNDELESRNQELTQVNDDLINLVGAIEVPVVMVGLDGRIRRFTPAAARSLNLIGTDIGRPIADIRPGFMEPIARVIESVAAVDEEIQERGGQWFRLRLKPYLTAEKRFDGVVISLIDINHLKRELDESRRLLERSEQLANSVRVPLAVVDRRFTIQSFNNAFRELFASHKIMLGQDFFGALGVVGDVSGLRAEFGRISSAGVEIRDRELEIDLAGRGRRTLNINAHKIDWDEALGDATLVSLDDITDRRRIEHDLVLSEEKYRGLVDGAHDAILSVNSEGIVEFVNEKVETLFGYRPDEILGRSIEALGSERLKILRLIQSGASGRAPIVPSRGDGAEFFARRKNGAEFPVDVSLSPRETDHGTMVTVILRDISERKATEHERELLLERERRARSDAESANKIKDVFLATLSHELRTPMTSILSWSQLIQRGVLPPDKLKHGIEVIEQSAKAQGQLIDDLLDVSRIQAGKLALSFQDVDPTQAIGVAIDSVRPLADAKNVRIETEFATHGAYIWADPRRLQQIVWNLVSNAVKFSSHDSTVQIRSKVVRQNEGADFVSIEVTDRGRGIKKDFLPLLFKRFSQADSGSTRQSGGLGLGLFIVSDLCRLMGGSVSALSEGLGTGATFTVRFSVKPQIEASQAEAATGDKPVSEESGAGRPDLTGLSVLIVDDEPSALEVLDETLKSFGAITTPCGSAAEALVALKARAPDVIVSDIAMPGEDGYSFIQKVRSLGRDAGGTTPALALTAYASADDIRRALSSGFNSHVAKPFDAFLLGHEVYRLSRAGR